MLSFILFFDAPILFHTSTSQLLIGEEPNLLKSRLELLLKDTTDNSIIGIEIKRSATKENIKKLNNTFSSRASHCGT